MDAKKGKPAKETVEQQDLKDPKAYKAAIQKGKAVLAEGGSKADAARAIKELLSDEDRDVILRAFVEGATITEKGAPTYFYNIQRKARRKNGSKEVKPSPEQ